MSKIGVSVDGLKVRQDILQKIKNQVGFYLGVEPSFLRRYALNYKKDIERKKWTVASSQDLDQALSSAEIIFGGDFHAFAQAQRVHLRHLRELVKKFKIVLAVECVDSRYQSLLDGYVRGEVAEDIFLKKVKWEKRWGFPWSQYKPLMDLVRESGGKCVALNREVGVGAKKLTARDAHAAEILKPHILGLQPNEKIYVIYGDLHLAQKHLPQQVSKKVKKTLKTVTMYLNPEKIYFQLFKKNLEHKVNIIRFSKSEFCLLESPPWVKWQSYLLFLEETFDHTLEDDEVVDYGEHIATLLRLLASDLDQKISADVRVYSFRDHDFIDLLSEKLSPTEFLLAKTFVFNDISFYHPKYRIAYLARGTVNYAAQLTGLIFHSHFSAQNVFDYQMPNQFERLIWQDSIAFFLSKLINPHRKSLNMNDLKKQLAAFSPEDQGESALKVALDQKMHELLLTYGSSPTPLRVERKNRRSQLVYYNASKILGALMGERIYQGYKTGRLSRSQVRDWLEKSSSDEKFDKFYIQVLKELDRIEIGDKHGQ